MSISKSLALGEREWKEIHQACSMKAAMIKDGRYGDPEGEECSSWGAHLSEISEKVVGLLDQALELPERDWREIYYACESKAALIEEGDAAGAAKLREIIVKIETLTEHGLVL